MVRISNDYMNGGVVLLFNKVLASEDCAHKDSYFCRQAVRAVVIRNDKLLLVHTNKGDYKFPGGGIEQGESYSEALKREVLEETGYHVDKVKELIGITIEKRHDKFDPRKIFEMKSHYYLCHIESSQVGQTLDDYEAEQEFEPVWITLDEALIKNQELLNYSKNSMNSWVVRETFVMEELCNYKFQ